MFSCDYCEIFKKSYVEEHLQKAALASGQCFSFFGLRQQKYIENLKIEEKTVFY